MQDTDTRRDAAYRIQHRRRPYVQASDQMFHAITLPADK